MNEQNEIQVIDPGDNKLSPATGGFISPALDINAALQLYNAQRQFISAVLIKDTDYGSAGGAGKDSLYKPGAEKLCRFFGLFPKFTAIKEIEDFTGKEHDGEPFFFYRFECTLYRIKDGLSVGSADGSANSWEIKYRYRWLSEDQAIVAGYDPATLVKKPGKLFEFGFAIDRAETTGKYGKPPEYWQNFKNEIAAHRAVVATRTTRNGSSAGWEIDSTMYRIPNPDICDQANTILKMAQKRAFIAATLIVCNASDYFTQDMEDFTHQATEDYEPRPAATVNSGSINSPVAEAKEIKVANRTLGEYSPAELLELSENPKAAARLREAAALIYNSISKPPSEPEQPTLTI